MDLDFLKWRFKRVFVKKKSYKEYEKFIQPPKLKSYSDEPCFECSTFMKGDVIVEVTEGSCAGRKITYKNCDKIAIIDNYMDDDIPEPPSTLQMQSLKPYYIGLCKSICENTVIGEPSELNGYSRQMIFSDDFKNGYNTREIMFCMAIGYWGKIQYAFLTDNRDYDNKDVLEVIDLINPRTIMEGDTPSFGVGSLNLSGSSFFLKTDPAIRAMKQMRERVGADERLFDQLLN